MSKPSYVIRVEMRHGEIYRNSTEVSTTDGLEANALYEHLVKLFTKFMQAGAPR